MFTVQHYFLNHMGDYCTHERTHAVTVSTILAQRSKKSEWQHEWMRFSWGPRPSSGAKGNQMLLGKKESIFFGALERLPLPIQTTFSVHYGFKRSLHEVTREKWFGWYNGEIGDMWLLRVYLTKTHGMPVWFTNNKNLLIKLLKISPYRYIYRPSNCMFVIWVTHSI